MILKEWLKADFTLNICCLGFGIQNCDV